MTDNTPIKELQEPSAELPAGKTCGDCAHWRRCSNLIDDLNGKETHCDWAPSRFKEWQYQCSGCKQRFTMLVSLGCNCGGNILALNIKE